MSRQSKNARNLAVARRYSNQRSKIRAHKAFEKQRLGEEAKVKHAAQQAQAASLIKE